MRILMIGPLPPPKGGVANFVQNIRATFASDTGDDIEVFRTGGEGPDEPAPYRLAKDLARFLRFVGTGKGRDADIVHVHTSSYYSFLRNVPYLLWAKEFLRVRTVVHIHGGMFKDFYEGSIVPLRYLVRWALRSADAVIVTSRSWIAVIKTISGREDAVHSLANGFDPNTFHPDDKRSSRRVLGIPPEGKILVSVGILEEVKGQGFLIDALPKVRSEHGDVRLYIIGDGSLRSALEEKARTLGVEGCVTFVPGGHPPEKVATWIQACDLFVLPSLSEGNPTVMFESLGCGRPFIGTAVGGIPDVIDSDRLGLLCRPADPEGLASIILDALSKDWNAQEISALARMYSWGSIASQLSAIYDQVDRKR